MVIEGPLAPWAAQMVERLAELSYSPYTTNDHLALMWNGSVKWPRGFLLRAFGRDNTSQGCQGRPKAAHRGSLDNPVRGHKHHG